VERGAGDTTQSKAVRYGRGFRTSLLTLPDVP
jgi:hypothetical protein